MMQQPCLLLGVVYRDTDQTLGHVPRTATHRVAPYVYRYDGARLRVHCDVEFGLAKVARKL